MLCIHVWVHAMEYMKMSETTYVSQFSPSTTWVLETEPRVQVSGHVFAC